MCTVYQIVLHTHSSRDEGVGGYRLTAIARLETLIPNDLHKMPACKNYCAKKYLGTKKKKKKSNLFIFMNIQKTKEARQPDIGEYFPHTQHRSKTIYRPKDGFVSCWSRPDGVVELDDTMYLPSCSIGGATRTPSNCALLVRRLSKSIARTWLIMYTNNTCDIKNM